MKMMEEKKVQKEAQFQHKRSILVYSGFRGDPVLFSCVCGYEGSTSLYLSTDEMREDPGSIGSLTRSNLRFVRPDTKFHVCPKCQRGPDITMITGESEIVIDYVKIYDNREEKGLISLSIGASFYYYSRRVNKIGYKKKRLRITTNIHTGITYLISGCHIFNITYSFGSRRTRGSRMAREVLYQLLSPANDYVVERGYIDTVKEFYQTVFEARGIRWAKLEEFDLRHLTDMHIFIRFPQLQALPFRNYGTIPPHMRRKLKDVPARATDLFRFFTGHTSKALRKYTTSPFTFSLIMRIAPLIKEPSNILKLLEADFIVRDEMEGADRVHRPVFNTSIPARSKMLPKAFNWLKQFHQDETHFVNRLLRIQSQYNNPRWRPYNDEPMHLAMFTINNMVMVLLDTYETYCKIKEIDPNYQVCYRNDIQRLHDDLSRDYRRYRHANREIPYTEEQESWQMQIGNYSFVLAPDTYSLVDVGSRLQICVGGYADSAFSKRTNIVVVFRDEEVYMCLEVLPTRGNRGRYYLNQAKLYRNHLPNKEDAAIVAQWCEKNKIRYADCYDLRALYQSQEDEQLLLDEEDYELLDEEDAFGP